MGRILNTTILKNLSLGVLVATIFLITPGAGLATNYNGWMTGYAFGNLYGSGGKPIVQTDFANHSPSYCPSDPAAYWP